MSIRNYRKNTGETLGKTGLCLGVPNLDPSRSRSDSESKPKNRVRFVDIDNGSPLNNSRGARAKRFDDPKTSEYAFFKKLKLDTSLRHGSNLSNKVEKDLNLFDSGSKTSGINFPVKDKRMNSSFETARHGSHGSFDSPVKVTPKESEQDLKQSSAALSAINGCQGINDHRGDIFSTKRQKLRQWVRDISFPDIDDLTSSGYDLVSVLLSRLLPGTEEKQAFKIPNEEWMDRHAKAKVVDSPQSDLLNRFNGDCMRFEHRPHMENSGPMSWGSTPRDRIIPSLQFRPSHVLTSFVPRDTDTEENSLESRGRAAISYPKGNSFSSPPFLKHKALLLDEETQGSYSQRMSSYPIPSPQFMTYKPLYLNYHKERVGYSSGSSFQENREPALLLEWDTMSRRNMNDLSLSYFTKFITYPSLPSSSGNDHLWSSNDTSHNSDIMELYPLSCFMHEPIRHIIQDIDPVSDLNQRSSCHVNSLDDLTRGNDYFSPHKSSSVFYHHLSSSLFFEKESWKWLQLSGSTDEYHSSAYESIKGTRAETMPLSLFSTDNVNLLESPCHERTHHFESLDWPTFCCWPPQAWTSS